MVGVARLQLPAEPDQLAEAIDKKPGAIVLLPADSASIVPTVKQANEAGIPIICVNRFPEGGDYLKSYSDDAEAGRMQGEFMAANLTNEIMTRVS